MLDAWDGGFGQIPFDTASPELIEVCRLLFVDATAGYWRKGRTWKVPVVPDMGMWISRRTLSYNQSTSILSGFGGSAMGFPMLSLSLHMAVMKPHHYHRSGMTTS